MSNVRPDPAVLFAMIPLLFGVQQIVEGMLWLSFRFDDQLLNVTMTYLFVMFSHVLWPIFLPFSIGLMETVAWRKKVISAFRITGIATGLYLLYFIVRFPVTSEVHGNMVYVLPYVKEQPVLDLYLAATCVAPFFSSHRIINIFGVMALLLFMVAYWFYTVAFFSVWCFFAAILSVVIYLHFKFGNERNAMGTQLNS
jgi:hypothetical protein